MNTQNAVLTQQADTLYRQGIKAHQEGHFAAAEQSYRRALQADARHVGALHMLGVLAAQAGQYLAGADLMARASALAPQDFSILNNLGHTLVRARRFEDALTCLDAAMQLQPDSPQVHNNRGNALNGLGRQVEAVQAYDRALQLSPNHAETWANKCTTLCQLLRFEQALACGERAVALAPDSALAHNAKGMALYGLRKWTEANACFVEALRLQPDRADALYNRGMVYFNNRRWDQAEPFLEAATRQDPANGDYLVALANNRHQARRYGAALQAIDQAQAAGVQIDNLPYVRSMLTTAACDWRRRDEEVASLRESAVQTPTPPFSLIALDDDAMLQRQTAACWALGTYAPIAGLAPFQTSVRQPGQKIRVGYFSADFHAHATMYLMAELLELHDPTRFEIIAFSFGPTTDDPWQQRARAAFHHWEDVREASDREIIDRARALQLDIAVDLKGYTGDARPGIFMARVAPLQVSYLGYPGTFGAPGMDYLLADRHLVSEADLAAYSEKVVTLPRTYQVNDRKRVRPLEATSRPSRTAAGLPESGFVFCCFNGSYKITPQIFDIWMRLLQQVPGSVLWLLDDGPDARDNLQREARQRGVDSERLVFAPRVDLVQHLARMPLADLFLDTFPCNAHTTASESLWMGLPLITLAGQSFASRVAASLLHAAQLPQLVTRSEQAYEDLALRLARSPAELHALRQHLTERSTRLALFDTPVLVRDIERAYRLMVQRHELGQQPDHIVVPAND